MLGAGRRAVFSKRAVLGAGVGADDAGRDQRAVARRAGARRGRRSASARRCGVKLVVKEPMLCRPTERQMSATERSVRAQQRRRPLQPAGQQVGVRRLAEGAPELAAEVRAGEARRRRPGRRPRAARSSGRRRGPWRAAGGGLAGQRHAPQSRLAASWSGPMQPCWLVCVASLAIGQAAIALCGVRRWSWLAPAVGLALLCAVCWGTVRLPGDGAISAVVVLALGRRARSSICGVGWRAGERRCERALRSPCWPCSRPRCPSSPKATSASSAPASTRTCPSTCWRPTGSPHGEGSQLLHQGYPLGPHAIVVALNKGLGIGLVQGFTGLTIAVAVLASLTALRPSATSRRSCASPRPSSSASPTWSPPTSPRAPSRRRCRPSSSSPSSSPCARRPQPRLARAPAALRPGGSDLAVGSVYTYSFPGLIWLIGAAAIWAAAESPQPVRQLGGWRRCGGAENGGAAPARRPPRSCDRPRRLALGPLASLSSPS